MTEETKEPIKECSCDSKDEVKPAEVKIEVKETPKIEQPEIPKWATDFNTKFDKLQTDYTNISGQLAKLKGLETEVGVRPQTQVSNEGKSEEPFSLTKSLEKVKRWVEGDRETDCKITIPVDFLRGVNTQKVNTANGVMETYRTKYAQDLKIKEALTYTGTQSVPEEVPGIILEPGGISFVPVTQFAQYKEVKQGNNAAKFFKHDLPATATQTVGTVATIATMDIEAVTVTPSTITGVFLEVDTDDIEDNPYDVMGTVVKAGAAAFDDFIATDMLDTVSAEGTLTPLRWIRGDTGATITHSETAAVALDPTGIATGVEVLEDRGLLRGGAQPVCFLDPQQFKELVEDAELSNYVQFAKPEITTNYQMAELYGCRLVRTNAIQHKANTTNTAHNAVMCIPNHSYGVASKRMVNVKFHEIPEENQIWVTTNWRIKSGVVDANSIIRISTTD